MIPLTQGVARRKKDNQEAEAARINAHEDWQASTVLLIHPPHVEKQRPWRKAVGLNPR